MDDPECDTDLLYRTYRGFETINPLISNWRRNFNRHIVPLARTNGSATILDVGCGGGDIPRYLKRLAHRKNVDVRITGIDPDTRAIAYARSQVPSEDIAFRNVSLGDIVKEGESYDFVISNHVIHHLPEDELRPMLIQAVSVTRHAVLFEDICRSEIAYGLFSLAALPLARNSFLRTDGLTSIRKSYTQAELQAIVGDEWKVTAAFPYRLLLHYESSS